MNSIRLIVEFDPAGMQPREVRKAFAQALRDAIAQSRMSGDIDPAVAEELWRVVPDPERA